MRERDDLYDYEMPEPEKREQDPDLARDDRQDVEMRAATKETTCWHCSKAYSMYAASCRHCCATNPNISVEIAGMEAQDESRIAHYWYSKNELLWCVRCGSAKAAE